MVFRLHHNVFIFHGLLPPVSCQPSIHDKKTPDCTTHARKSLKWLLECAAENS